MSSTTSHVFHVGNFHLRSECEQAARDATWPAIVGTPSDHAASYCVRAYDYLGDLGGTYRPQLL